MSKFSHLPEKLRTQINDLLEGGVGSDLDRAHEQMRGQLRSIEQGVTDIATEQQRLEDRIEQLQSEVDDHNAQAREAVQQGEDQQAREHLEAKRRALKRIDRLEGELEDLQQAEEELLERRDELAERIEEFRTEKEQLKARKRAAEAKADAEEAASVDASDAERTAQRASEEVEASQARAAAMDELREEGVFDGPLTPDDEIQEELDAEARQQRVDAEIETIREELDADDEGDDEDEGDDGA